MHKIYKQQKGFTMVELILVIALLSILSAVAFSQFINVTAASNSAAREGVVGSVRSGIYLVQCENSANPGIASPNPPASLDSDNSSPWFDTVIMNGVIDDHWSSPAANIFVYTNDDSVTTSTYTYAPLGAANEGSFTCTAGACI